MRSRPKNPVLHAGVYIDMHLFKWQIKSRQEQKHLSPPKCTVKSHQKLCRMTGWKHGNVETEWKHVMKLAYFTTHLWFFLWNLSLAIVGQWILKKPSLIWNLDFDTFWRDYCEHKPYSKTWTYPKSHPQICKLTSLHTRRAASWIRAR